MICKHCECEFEPYPGKPGYINECPNCAVEPVERVGGITVWLGKHTPVTIVCSKDQAKDYAKRTRRIGAGVMGAIAPRGAEKNNPGTKVGSGAEAYAVYYVNGEKRTVKS